MLVPLLEHKAERLLIEKFRVEGVACVGVGAKGNVKIGCPARVGLAAAFGFMMFDTVERECHDGLSELVVMEGGREYFGNRGFIGGGLMWVGFFRVGELE